jgi:hypothetical protein
MDDVSAASAAAVGGTEPKPVAHAPVISATDAKRIAKREGKRAAAEKATRYDPFRSVQVFNVTTHNAKDAPAPGYHRATSVAETPADLARAEPSAKVVRRPAEPTSAPDASAAAAPQVSDVVDISAALAAALVPTNEDDADDYRKKLWHAMELVSVCMHRNAKLGVCQMVCQRCDAEFRREPGYELLGYKAARYRTHWARCAAKDALPQTQQCFGCDSPLSIRNMNIEGIPLFKCLHCENESILVQFTAPVKYRRLRHFGTDELVPLMVPGDNYLYSAGSCLRFCIPSLMSSCPMCGSARAPLFAGMTSARQAYATVDHYNARPLRKSKE